MEPVIFMLCLTLHTIEEALWLTEWRAKTMPNTNWFLKKEHFLFAVLGITILGYLAAGLYALFPNNLYFAYTFVGFVGAMLINAIAPHLVLTIQYKKYCPGVFTGCFLILPFHTILLYNAISRHLGVIEVILSTLIVGAVLLAAIPFFISIAKKYFDTQ